MQAGRSSSLSLDGEQAANVFWKYVCRCKLAEQRLLYFGKHPLPHEHLLACCYTCALHL